MAFNGSLPPALQQRLDAVALRIRLTRLVYGLSLLFLVLILTAAVCVGVDGFLHLDANVRFGLLIGWAALGLGVGFVSVLLPMLRRLEPASLAAFIELRYPELAERLTSAVELSGDRAQHHGSPVLIDLLMQDTAAQTDRLRVTRAVRAGVAVTVAVFSGVLLATAALVALIKPQDFQRLTTRFLAPWYTPPIVLDYSVEALTGDIKVGRGRPLILTARVVALADRQDAEIPSECRLVITDEAGKPQTLTMFPGPGDDTFEAMIDEVNGDLTYFVESGQARSLTHKVTAVEPPTIVSDSVVTTVTPPDYAHNTIKVKSFNGLATVTVLQHSRVKMDFKFNQPIKQAHLQRVGQDAFRWRFGNNGLKTVRSSDGPLPGTPDAFKYRDFVVKALNEPIPDAVAGVGFVDMVGENVQLSEDRLSGSVTIDADQNDTLLLHLTNDHDIPGEVELYRLAVKADQPPAFFKVSLSEKLKSVLPSDRLPISFTVTDDVGVQGAILEWKVNDGEVHSEVISLTGVNTPEATAQHILALAGKVKEKDSLHLRLKAMDNRRLPEKKLDPQVVYYPAQDQWLTLVVAEEARPIKEQEIERERDEVNKKLDKLWDEMRHEQRGLYNLRQEAKKEAALSPANQKQLKELRQENRDIEEQLRELAEEVAQTPELARVADGLQELAEQEMKRAGEGLRNSEKDREAEPREEKLQAVDRELDKALEKLDQLRQANNKAAKERLDKARFDAAAAKQQDLADKTGELAKQDPKKDPQAAEQARDLQKEQGDLNKDLQKLAEQNEMLREALNAARGEQAQELAEQARDLAQQQRDLAEQAKNDDPRRQQQLADLARKQQELAEKAARLAKETQAAAQAALTRPLKPEDAQKAVENLKNGDAGEAIKNQDLAAKELDRLADQLDRAIDLARDPREAARQLSRMQQNLQQRLNEELAKKADPKPLAERLADLQKEQDALKKAVEQLDVPEQNKLAQADQKAAAARAQEALNALKGTAPRNASTSMDQVRQALDKLAQDLPSLPQRQKAAQDAVAQMRQQQEGVNQLAEQALKPFEKEDPNALKTRQALAEKLADAMKKQAEAAERLSKLDAPGSEARKDRTEQALNQALRDLLEARPQDIPASQQAARRELERLEQALKGQTPADEQAQQLADRQQQLAQESAQLAGDPKATPEQLAELKRKQQELAQQTQNLQAPEAPQRQHDAAQAARQAEQSANANPTSPESLKKMQDAARALQQLAEQMAGQEQQADKAERLARKQRKAADEAEKAGQNPQAIAPEKRDELQRLTRETRDLRAGDQAQAEKKKAVEALDRLANARPQDQARAQQEAADALRDLADKLAGRDTPADKAAELARQQRDLARQKEPSADQQRDLARQMDRLDPKGAEDLARQAREQMDAARRALDQAKNPDEARAQLDQAADAAEKLARQLAEKQAQQPPMNPQQQQAAKPGDSPQKLAQQLADKQRDLMKQTQQARSDLGWFPGDKERKKYNEALEKIDREQQSLNKQASELPADGAQKLLEQARQSMNQAQKALGKKDGYNAQWNQRDAADALQKLAQNLPREQPNKDQAQQPRPNPLNQDQSQQARDLAQQQRELRDQAEKLAQQKPRNQAEQQARQDQIEQKANDLLKDLQKLAEQMNRQPQAQQETQQAAQNAEKAQQQMQQAREQARQGNQGQEQQARDKAAEALEQAGKLAQQAGQKMTSQPGQKPDQQQLAEALRQAQKQMQQAEKQLGQGEPQPAQTAMQQAADLLKQAAQKLGLQQQSQQAKNQPGQPMPHPQPGPTGVTGSDRIDASMLSPDMKKYAGQRWGELPGELQTKILQDMKARYGDDYARIIKLYFEQLADTKPK